MNVVLALLPDFALILGGAGLRRWLHLDDHFWQALEKLIYVVLFPALLVNSLARTHIDWPAALPLVATVGGGMLAAMLAARAFGGFGIAPRDFAARQQCAFRFNTYIGLAIVGTLHGAPGIAVMAIIIGAMVPLANFVAVSLLARHGESSVWRELAGNPLILATLAGLAINAAGIALPDTLLRILGRLAEASITLGLLAVGAGLRLAPTAAKHSRGGTADVASGARGSTACSAWLLVVKLAIKPAVVWALAAWIGLPPLQAQVALAWAALPTANSAYILTRRMGGDGRPVAWLVSVSTLLAMLTLPLWLNLAQ